MSGSRVRWRQFAPWLSVVTVLVVVAVLAGAPNEQGGYLDPDGTGPTGLKALRELLVSFDARVDVAYDPAPAADVMLMSRDVIADEDLSVVEQWVSDGGVLVVADPWSALIPVSMMSTGFLDPVGATNVSRGTCDIAALGSLDVLDPGAFEPILFEVGEDTNSCFGDGVNAYVVAERVGDGAIVAIGGPDVLMNQNLAEMDNAAFAVALMAAEPGTRVLMLERGPNSPGGNPTLASAIPSGVTMALVQLFVAFGFYAWFRGRRLGKPVVEHQPVQIEGSELVLAVGGLVRRSRDPAAAARVLRDDIRRRLTSRLGLAPDTEPRIIAEVTTARTGIDPDLVSVAVAGTPVTNDEQLLDLARNIDTIRKEVLDGPV